LPFKFLNPFLLLLIITYINLLQKSLINHK
jgi:hypothetical protein